MTVINTNIGATITANSLAKNERAMNTAMERLSTGKRINSAADDAAGLAISQRLNAQVKGLDQAARNANDAISMLQTADGAAIEITNMLQRMRELAVQATSDSNTTDDVSNLDLEFKALAEEIDRIVDATQWNGENILDGTGGDLDDGSFTFQIGANDGQTVTVDFSDFNLGDGGTTTSTSLTESTKGTSLAAAVYTGAVATLTENTTYTFNDGSNTLTVDIDSGADLATQVAAIKAADGYSDLDFAVSAGTNAFTMTYASKGGISTAPTLVSIATDDINPMGKDLSGMTATTATITTTTANVIATLDTAISGVTTQRATFGAVMNRLEYTVDNLANVSQNTSASMSRISDADYAAETTELARTQIIQQAGTAMLSQANQQAQSVLALLK